MDNESCNVDEGLCVENWNPNPTVLRENESNIFIKLAKTQCFSFVVALKAKLFNNRAKLNNFQRHCS